MSIVSHKQWDHMIDKLNYFGSPKFFKAHKPLFRPYLRQLKKYTLHKKYSFRCPSGQLGT